ISQNSGLASSRPDATGVNPVLGNYRDTLQYLDRSAFAAVRLNTASGLPARPRNAGRDPVHGPGLTTVDLTIGKTSSVRENINGRILAAALNSFNHPNFSAPNLDVPSSLCGRSSAARGARVIQLSAKFSF